MKTNEKLSFDELYKGTSWEEAIIVFAVDSFNREHSEESRSYKVSRSCKYFDPMMNGNSLFGDCLDGTDQSVRLDWYMSEGWDIEHCYITK